MKTFKIKLTTKHISETGNKEYTSKVYSKECYENLVFGEAKNVNGRGVCYEFKYDKVKIVLLEAESESKAVDKVTEGLHGRVTFFTELLTQNTTDSVKESVKKVAKVETPKNLDSEEDLQMDSRYKNGSVEISPITGETLK